MESDTTVGVDFPDLIQNPPEEIDSIIFQLILTYENGAGEKMDPVRFATFVVDVRLPEEMTGGIVMTETANDDLIWDKIVTEPQSFEDIFKMPNFGTVSPKGIERTITPETGFGPFATDSSDFESETQ